MDLYGLHIYASTIASYYLMSMVFNPTLGTPLILGMSRREVHVVAGRFLLGTPGCGRDLFH
jgi:hypothetical protein